MMSAEENLSSKSARTPRYWQLSWVWCVQAPSFCTLGATAWILLDLRVLGSSR
jgi:hypothetical protein